MTLQMNLCVKGVINTAPPAANMMISSSCCENTLREKVISVLLKISGDIIWVVFGWMCVYIAQSGELGSA